MSSFHDNLDKVGGELGEGEEENGVEKHPQDLASPFSYVEDVKDFLLDVLGKDDGAESNAGEGNEDCDKEEDVTPKVGRALHVLPEDVRWCWSP